MLSDCLYYFTVISSDVTIIARVLLISVVYIFLGIANAIHCFENIRIHYSNVFTYFFFLTYTAVNY